MRPAPYFFLLICSIIILISDFYTYKGIKKININFLKRHKRIFKYIFWSVPISIIIALFLMLKFRTSVNPQTGMIYFHYLSGAFLLFNIPKLIFIVLNLVDDIYHFIKYLAHKIKHIKSDKSDVEKISRSTFLTRAGIIIAGIPFVSIIYGIGWGRFNFLVRKSNISSSKIPKDFDGFKIVQFSDFHLGSFISNEDKVKEVVKLINAQHPDLILFTGDLVNNLAAELESFVPILAKLRAKYGMYSILGNHDYGEYVPWNSQQEKQDNLNRIIEFQKNIGFKMMLNESTKINIGDSFITLIGVENWGLPPFPQYGD